MCFNLKQFVEMEEVEIADREEALNYKKNAF